MIRVPSFLLKRLYVKGSLRNTEEGFQLSLKNCLGSGYAQRLLPLKVDGEEMPVENSFFLVEGREAPFSAVNHETPFTLAINRVSHVVVKGRQLKRGPHKVGVGFSVVGLGDLSFEIADMVAG